MLQVTVMKCLAVNNSDMPPYQGSYNYKAVHLPSTPRRNTSEIAILFSIARLC